MGFLDEGFGIWFVVLVSVFWEEYVWFFIFVGSREGLVSYEGGVRLKVYF